MGPALALASAVTFGVADFAGGLAARRTSAISVTTVAQAAGFAVLVPTLLWLPGTPSTEAFLLGAFAGLGGAGGLVLYLRALAIGPMGVVAPLAGLVGAMLPLGWGMLAGERLTLLDTLGVALGLVAVVAVAYVRGAMSRATLGGPLLALAAGAGFGTFFVLLDATPDDSGLWPLLGARLAALAMLGALLVVRRRGRPDARTLPLALASGTLDMFANILFVLATRAGLLSLTALITSLYPVVVALLARQLLAERLTRVQSSAVACALAAVVFIAV